MPEPTSTTTQNAIFTAASTADEVAADLDLNGKTILVTGCNSGLGLETMRVLSSHGARVLGTARTMDKATAACAKVGGDTVPIVCELSDPASARAAAEAVQEPLDAVIANAGVMALQARELQHGVEAHLFTNHVGHFIVINGLLDRLKSNARVAILSSGAHAYAPECGVDFDDLAWDRPYSPWPAYGQSKLANILFAKHLATRLQPGQTANALHPGVIYTPLWRHIPAPAAERMKSTMTFKTIPQGAATQVFVATHPAVEGATGAYFSDCATKEPSAQAQDEALAARLWDWTEGFVAGL
jgi:NAD(P)-dependent dehydrogenase (short-subunit alcohol dehydrogenase family)